MIFSSIEFLSLFLPLFLFVYYLSPPAWHNAVLLIGSWLFYAWWSPVFLLLLIGLTVLSWIGGMMIGACRGKTRVWLLALLIIINASTLFWFKYINILVDTYNDFSPLIGTSSVHWQRVALPIGLSFIILQAISYLCDVHSKVVSPQRHFVRFAAYSAMFGQLIAGPILRYQWIEHELALRKTTWLDFSAGARRFMIGMSMKVLIADTLSPVVDAIFQLPDPSFADAWLGCIGYTLQLFFDFAGYSAMAIGLGQMLGFRIPENFNHPYLAVSIQDFWRRWHISLSSWIRDYMYVPLGGNRKGHVRTYVNLLITMAIAGMWHGSDNWNFLLWGLAHGIALSLGRLWKAANWMAIPALSSRILTLLFVSMAWVVFRAPTFEAAKALYTAQLGLRDWALSDALHVIIQTNHITAGLLGICCIWVPYFRNALRRHIHTGILVYMEVLWPAIGFLLAFALITSRKAVPFLYFQF